MHDYESSYLSGYRKQRSLARPGSCSPANLHQLETLAETIMDSKVRPQVVEIGVIDAAVGRYVAQCRANNAGRPTGHFPGDLKFDCGCLANNMRGYMMEGKPELFARSRSTRNNRCIDRSTTSASIDQNFPGLRPKVSECARKRVVNGMEPAMAVGQCRALESRGRLN